MLPFSIYWGRSRKHHEASGRLLERRKLVECGKSGFWSWIWVQYWWYVSESSLQHDQPDIRMVEFEYTPVEHMLRYGHHWHQAIPTHIDPQTT